MHRFRILLIAGLACLASWGCTALEPKADPSRFFTLTAVSQFKQSGLQAASNPGGLSIGIGPIKFPGYLDREQLVTRVSQNRFQVAENDRWAEPLEQNFTRVLLQNLTALLPTAQFTNYPWRLSERPEYQVAIDVLRFESNADGQVELIARWLVRQTATKQNSTVKETRLSAPVKDQSTEATVAALSDAVGTFSREIARAVTTLEPKAKP